MTVNCDRWLAGMNADTYNDFRQKILIEQFMGKVPEDLKLYPADKRLNTVKDAAWRTDEYITLQRVTKKPERPMFNKFEHKQVHSNGNNSNTVTNNNTSSRLNNVSGDYKFKPSIWQEKGSNNDKSYLTCIYCHKKGYLMKVCYKRKRENDSHVNFVCNKCISKGTFINNSCCDENVSSDNPYVFDVCLTRETEMSAKTARVTAYRDTEPIYVC